MSEFRVLEEDGMEVLAESALPSRDESNMVEKKLDQLITAVKGMKPVAPVVNVPAPVVNVQNPEFLTISPEQMKELTKKREVYIGGGNSGMVKLVTGTDVIVNPATAEKQDTIIGHVDGLETLSTATNTKLDTVIGHVDGLETLSTDIKTNQTNGTQIAQMYAKTSDTTFQVPRLDTPTHSLQIIDYAHHEIHVGSHYFVTGVATLPLNDVLDLTFVTPNTTNWIHWLWKIDTSSEMAWYIYEGAVITNALANAITPFNNNRNSLNTSGAVLKYEIQADLAAANTDTNVTTATLLKSGISGAGRSGGSDSRESEVILKQNTIYCLRAVATVAGYIDFNMEWYEHTNKTA